MVQFARGNNLPRVKLSNQSSILRMIYHCGPIKRAEISKRLGLTLPTITTNVNDMIAEGIVRETDCQNADLSSPGRRARPVEIVPESRHFVGVEIQEYRRTVCVLNFRGETIVQRMDELHLTDYAQSMERTCAVVQQALAEAGLRLDQVNGICLCLPGLVNSGSGILDTCPRFGWSNKNIVADAAALIGYRGPIMAENNACARAYGAQLFHHEKLDGSGYPRGLKGCDLTVPQRIVAIADIVSALTGTRSYKDSFPKEKTCSILNDMAERGLIDSVIVERIVENYDVIMGAVREKATPILEIYQEMQTGYLELLRLQDRFVYLPEMPYRKVDLDQAMRNVLSQEKFAADGGQGDVEGWLNTITVENVHPNTTVAIRMKGISGETGSLKLYAYGTDGTLKEVPTEKWHIQTEDGETPDTLSEDVLYEVHMTVEDGGDFDLSETEKEIKMSAVLGA